MTTTITRDYLRLGLRLGRHDDGIVDSYFGPADLALAIEQARRRCQSAMVNVALMLHEAGCAEAVSYLERWGLLDDEQAAHAVRFATEPGSRTYVTVYPAGFSLCQKFVAGDLERFRRLLVEQIRVRDLLDVAQEA